VFYASRILGLPIDPTNVQASRVLMRPITSMRLPGGRRDVHAHPALHAAGSAEHGGLARRQVGPRTGLRRHRELRVPRGCVDGPTRSSPGSTRMRFSAGRARPGGSASCSVTSSWSAPGLAAVRPARVRQSNQEARSPSSSGSSWRTGRRSDRVVAPHGVDGLARRVVPPGTGRRRSVEQIQALLDQATQHFAAADAALRAGDLATVPTRDRAAQAATEQARDRQPSGAQPSGSPSPSISASPSPSPPADPNGSSRRVGNHRSRAAVEPRYVDRKPPCGLRLPLAIVLGLFVLLIRPRLGVWVVNTSRSVTLVRTTTLCAYHRGSTLRHVVQVRGGTGVGSIIPLGRADRGDPAAAGRSTSGAGDATARRRSRSRRPPARRRTGKGDPQDEIDALDITVLRAVGRGRQVGDRNGFLLSPTRPRCSTSTPSAARSS
jgi:hypothetical protein